jgi:hypothetical protein
MSKTLKTESELIQLLNAELRRHDVCDGVTVTGIDRVDDSEIGANWDATYLRGSGTAVLPDCKRLFIGIKQSLRRQYDLFTDD